MQFTVRLAADCAPWHIGGWGQKRSGAESPTGNPSPAPIAIAPHASHARHDRSMARWISVARAKVGGHSCSPPGSRKVAPSSTCLFVHFERGITMVSWWTCPNGLTQNKVLVNFRSFEQGITMVFFTTRCRMLESRYKNKGLVNLRSFERGITMVSFTTRCRMLESRYKNMGLVNHG